MKLNLKTILIGLSALLLIFVFLPAISISGMLNVSLWERMTGLTMFGETVFEGNFLFVIPVCIPAVLIALWVLMHNRTAGLVSAILAIVNIIFWIILIGGLKSAIYEMVGDVSGYVDLSSYLTVSVTFWFVLDILVSLLVAAGSLMIFLGMVGENESDLKKMAGGAAAAAGAVKAKAAGAAKSASAAVQEKTAAPKKPAGGKVCPGCGNALPENALFCPVCGAKYEEPKSDVCPGCGAEKIPGAAFCPKCGTKYEG